MKTYELIMNQDDELDIVTTTSSYIPHGTKEIKEFKKELKENIKFLQDFLEGLN